MEIVDSQFAKAQINPVTWLIPLQCPYIGWSCQKKRWRAVLNFSKDFLRLGMTRRGGFQLEAQAISSRGAHLKRTIIIFAPTFSIFLIVKRGCRADSICSFRTNPQVLALAWLFQREVKGQSNNWTWPCAHPIQRGGCESLKSNNRPDQLWWSLMANHLQSSVCLCQLPLNLSWGDFIYR